MRDRLGTSFDRRFDLKENTRREDRFETARELPRCARWYFNAAGGWGNRFVGRGRRGKRSSEAAVTRSKPRDNLEENAARGEKRWNKDRGRSRARIVVKFTEETRDTWKATTKKPTFPRCPRISLYDCKNDPPIFLTRFSASFLRSCLLPRSIRDFCLYFLSNGAIHR